MPASLDKLPLERRLDQNAEVRSFIFGLLREWPRDREFDARQILAEHPELAQVPSAVAELAFEEYERRRRAGEQVSVDEFAAQFPGFSERLRGELGFLNLIEDDPGVVRALNESYFPQPGDTFLGYELLELLGCGNCSRVYVAREPDVGDRQVVVKLCVDGAREADTLGRLQHEGIVPVYSVHRHDESSLVALCMPYLTRTTLHDVLVRTFTKGHPPVRANEMLDAVAAVNGMHVPPGPARHSASWWRRQTYVDAIVDVGIQLAETLAFVHARQARHGDLKPSNVLVTGGGRSLLLDFNLSSWATRDGALGGTLPYMAPEQLERLLDLSGSQAPARWNPQADLFGLAATLYHVLTGRFPFGPQPEQERLADRAAEMLKRHRRGAQPPISYNPQVGRRLSQLMAACLSADPAARPQTAEELATALRSHFAPARRATRWVQRHALLSLGMAGISATAAVGLARSDFTTKPRSERSALIGKVEVSEVEKAAQQAAHTMGVKAMRLGDFESAIGHLDYFLRNDPQNVDIRFARGQARLLLAEELLRQAVLPPSEVQRERARELGNVGLAWLQQAREDFEFVSQLSKSPVARACAAYCRSRSHDRTVDAAETARWLLEGIGSLYPPEAAWNNVGYLWLHHHEYSEARDSLRAALEHNPSFGVAHCNLAAAWLMEASPRPGVTAPSKSTRECLEQALSSVEQAIALGFSDSDIHAMRVAILVQMAELTSVEQGSIDYREAALQAAEAAAAAGVAPERLRREFSISALFDRAELASRLESHVTRGTTGRLPRLINPLAGLALPVSLAGA